MPAQDHFDIAIVGAGAAGLAAAVTLRARPLRLALLEARCRLGGRAHTLHPDGLFPLDAGCGWLHSADRNGLAPLIEAAGLAIDRARPHWERQSANRHFSAADQRAFREAHDAFEGRLEAAARTGVDGPASDWFEPGGRWNPLIDAISGYYNGAEFDQVSVLDYAAYEDTGVNWRVRDGYGAGIQAVAGAAPAPGSRTILDCPVTRIDHAASPIALTTPRGTLTARAVIVTVPTTILAAERLVFDPPLARVTDAAAGLPLGLADKAFLHVARPEALAVEGHLFGHTDRSQTASYHLRPFGRPYIEVYVGGRHARALEDEGMSALTDFAMAELHGLLGSDLAGSLTPIAQTAWGRDPFSLGAYSHALPGHAVARAALAAAHEDRLFFAGEATHATFFSTAHGAWETGVRAAREAAAALGA